MASELNSGLPLSVTLKPTRITLGITAEEVNLQNVAFGLKKPFKLHFFGQVSNFVPSKLRVLLAPSSTENHLEMPFAFW